VIGHQLTKIRVHGVDCQEAAGQGIPFPQPVALAFRLVQEGAFHAPQQPARLCAEGPESGVGIGGDERIVKAELEDGDSVHLPESLIVQGIH
jgi:hypothetical protein